MSGRAISFAIALGAVAVSAVAALAGSAPARAEPATVIHIDFAYYNPVSLVLKSKHWVEAALGPDIAVDWVQSAGSNKALEFLNARSLDFGSTAGVAALLGRANGNPIKAIYVYSKPEWTALVTRADSKIESLADLAGKRIAVTRGTDPHIFLLRALASAGLGERDVKIIPLQHADGRLALDRGDVDAWSGLDPFMAQAELESHDRLFYRNPDLNTYGVLNTREAFLAEHPDLVEKVIAAYERGRLWSLAHQDEFAAIVAELMGASEGIGFLLLDGQQTGRPTLVIGAILMFALLGKLSDLLLARIGTAVLGWQDVVAGA